MKRLTVFLSIIFVLVFCSCGFAGPLQDEKNPELLSAILKLNPNAEALQRQDIDMSDCEEEATGLVEADFNGDGLNDYAVLLKIGVTEDTVYTYKDQSYPWKRLRLWLAVFLRKRKGGFNPVVLDRLEKHSYPAYVYLEVQPPGIVNDIDSRKNVKLKLPSIAEIFCGKSARVFYWVEKTKKFNVVRISD